MKPFPIPVVPFGPGSQAGDDGFDYLAMPSPEPLPRPQPPQAASRRDRAIAADLLDRLLGEMRAGGFDGCRGARLAISDVDAAARRALNESLGQGEVSAIVRESAGAAGWHVQESAFCGVWRVQRVAADAAVLEDLIEVNDMPHAVRRGAGQAAAARLQPGPLPPGVMNAPAVLHEIREHARRCAPGQPAHVINLSHLPFNEADHAALAEALGEGTVTILSRGFGNCRITSTAAPRVWRVQYFNSMSTLILDTVEVVDIPEAALANADDFADSRERLGELVAWLREA